MKPTSQPALRAISIGFGLVVGALPGGCGGDGSNSDAGAADAASSPADAGDDEYCPVVGYTPCSGDVVDTWQLRSLCPDDPEAAAAACEHPYDDRAVCTGTGNEAICDGTPSGTFTFNSDMTVDFDMQISLVTTWNFTDECLAAVVQRFSTPEERCADLDTTEGQTCTYDGHCTCVTDPVVESDQGSASYSIVGGDLVIGEDPPATFCVDGNRLTMDYYEFHPASWRYWVLERE